MKQIKFRAWVGSEKRMERDMFYINQWDGKCHYTQPYHYENEDDVKIYDCGEEEPVLMQYTGLKDVLGKEIYEGDVGSVDDKMGQIKYEPDLGGYIFEWVWSKNQHHLLLTCDVALDFAVIGNIYENPELLS